MHDLVLIGMLGKEDNSILSAVVVCESTATDDSPLGEAIVEHGAGAVFEDVREDIDRFFYVGNEIMVTVPFIVKYGFGSFGIEVYWVVPVLTKTIRAMLPAMAEADWGLDYIDWDVGVVE